MAKERDSGKKILNILFFCRPWTHEADGFHPFKNTLFLNKNSVRRRRSGISVQTLGYVITAYGIANRPGLGDRPSSINKD